MVETSGALFAAHGQCAVSSGFLVDPGAPSAGTRSGIRLRGSKIKSKTFIRRPRASLAERSVGRGGYISGARPSPSREGERKVVLAAHPRPSFADHHAAKKISPSRAKGRGRRSAQRRIQPCPRGAIRMLPPECASGAEAAQCRGRSPSGAPPRRLPERPNASAQPRPRFARAGGRRRYPRRQSRLSGAPRAPIVVPEGTMPGPPGGEVTNPARRNRTRSTNRPPPVDVPR